METHAELGLLIVHTAQIVLLPVHVNGHVGAAFTLGERHLQKKNKPIPSSPRSTASGQTHAYDSRADLLEVHDLIVVIVQLRDSSLLSSRDAGYSEERPAAVRYRPALALSKDRKESEGEHGHEDPQPHPAHFQRNKKPLPFNQVPYGSWNSLYR